MKFNLLFLALLAATCLLSGCNAGRSVKVNYETTQTVIVDDAKRTQAAGKAFAGIAKVFFKERPKAPYPLNQNKRDASGPPAMEKEPCEDCGGLEIQLPDLELDKSVEAVVYLAEDENGDVGPQRIEFKDATEYTEGATEYTESGADPPPHKLNPKKKRSGYKKNNSNLDTFDSISSQIENSVGAGEGQLLQYLLNEKREQREQALQAERTKQLQALLNSLVAVMNKPAQHETPSE